MNLKYCNWKIELKIVFTINIIVNILSTFVFLCFRNLPLNFSNLILNTHVDDYLDSLDFSYSTMALLFIDSQRETPTFKIPNRKYGFDLSEM